MFHLSPLSRRSFVGASALLPWAMSAHGARGQTPAVKSTIEVVASFSILADWVRNIGGNAIDLTSIVPAGGDTHTFDPAPDTVATIADARVIFAIGAGFEVWLDRIVTASGTDAPTVEVSNGLTLLSGDEEHDHGHDHSHGHDPHIWGDASNAITVADVIRDGLTNADPGNTTAYRDNAAAYRDELDALDTRIRDRVATVPESHRKLVTSHDTFGYYAHAYGFEIIGTALGSFSTEAGDPSARDIAMLIEEIKASGVPAIFAENVVNPALMQSIADEAGVDLAPPLYSDALGDAGSDGDTYIHMMEYNTETIVTALGGE